MIDARTATERAVGTSGYYRQIRASRAGVREGQTLAGSGVILQMPDGMNDRLKAPGELNDEVYLYANKIAS